VNSFSGPTGGTIWSVAFSPDGELLAGASLEGAVKLWYAYGRDLRTFAPGVRIYPMPASAVPVGQR
jgi:WD40 repeat protein